MKVIFGFFPVEISLSDLEEVCMSSALSSYGRKRERDKFSLVAVFIRALIPP